MEETVIQNQKNSMKNRITALLAAVLIAATSVADTNPCFTYMSRTWYPMGKDSGVAIYYKYSLSGAGVEIKAWHQSVAYYDMTIRTTTGSNGSTNSNVSFRPMVSALGGAIKDTLTTIVNPGAVDQPSAAASITVPWSDLCNLRGNFGSVEMWICEPGKTNVLSYGIVRIDSN